MGIRPGLPTAPESRTSGGVFRADPCRICPETGGEPTLIKEDIELMIRWVDWPRLIDDLRFTIDD